MHNKKLQQIAAICLATGLMFSNSYVVYADTDASIGTGEDIEIICPGANGNVSSGSSNQTSNSSSGNTYHATQAELNARNEKKGASNILSGWRDQAKSDSRNTGYETGSSNGDIIQVGSTTVSKSEIQDLLNYVSNFSSYKDQDHVNSFYNAQTQENGGLPHKTLPCIIDLSKFTSEQLKAIKQAIAANEGLYPSAAISFLKPLSGTGERLSYRLGSFPLLAINHGRYPGRLDYQGIRNDLIWGGFNDSYSWLERFNNYYNRFGTTSNQMEDYTEVIDLVDYHIYNIEENHLENINYTSDVRRWSVYRVGEENSGNPIRTEVTDNPRHAFHFSSAEAGDYVVIAEQEAKYTKSTYVSYDIIEYLADAKTQNLLYFNEKLVSNGSGKSIKVNETEETGYVPTGDRFTIHVNDLGSVETNGAATERVQ